MQLHVEFHLKMLKWVFPKELQQIKSYILDYSEKNVLKCKKTFFCTLKFGGIY